MPSNQPNILFVITDQQRWDALGCVGGWLRTPNLDALAERSLRFDRCITNSPVCVPARFCMLTGLYPHNTGVWQNCKHTVPPETPNWFQSIRDAGYRTALFGKTHWHPHGGDLRDREGLVRAYGFDEVCEATGPRASARCRSHMTDAWEQAGLWQAYRDDYDDRFSNDPQVVRPSPLPAELYYDGWVGEQARQYLDGYDRDQPWFCYVGFPGPHEPWDTPEPWAGLHDPAAMPQARPFPEDVGERPRGVLDTARGTPQHRLVDPERASRLRADYADNIALIDDQVGRLMRTIEERGELDNTVVLFTSDHGEMNGDADLVYKFNFLDGAVRVPLLLHVPSAATGVVDQPVELNDVGPTLAELAGATLNHEQFAVSLAPLTRDPATTIRLDALSEISGELMLVNARWKLAVNDEAQPYLLFDLRADPGETTNLAGDPGHADVADALRLRLLERVVQSQRRLDAR
jgi:choline-sulfatase